MKQKISQNIGILTLKFIAFDIIADIIYWPIWWYTRGLKILALYIYHEIIYFENRIGLKIWFANMFKPMFGQRDWQGRFISFFVRFFILIYKLVKFIIWILILLVFLLVWVSIIPLSAYQIILHFLNASF